MNVVFMGTKEVGADCLNILCQLIEHRDDCRVVAVLTNSRSLVPGKLTVSEVASRANIPVLDSLDSYLQLKESIDLVLSVQFHRLLGPEHLEKSQFNVNFHMAPLPEYRGCNQFSFAIVDGAEEFGTTAHHMDVRIDHGPIIAETRFPIPSDCFVDELYELTYEHTIQLFADTVPLFLDRQFPVLSLEGTNRQSSLHYRDEIRLLKTIDLSDGCEHVERHVRATSMPGFSPPRLTIAGRMFELHPIDATIPVHNNPPPA